MKVVSFKCKSIKNTTTLGGIYYYNLLFRHLYHQFVFSFMHLVKFQIAEMKRIAEMRREESLVKTSKITKDSTVNTGKKSHQKSNGGTIAVVTCNRCMCEAATPIRQHNLSVEHKVCIITTLFNLFKLITR